MRKNGLKIFTVLAAFMLLSATLEPDAYARAAGGRSMGSRGSRSYSLPGGSYSRPAPSREQYAPQTQPYRPYQQPSGGGFFRSIAGGLMGGFLGGMLFRSLGFAGNGLGGGGIGLFEIILIGGLLYLIFRMVRGRRRETPFAGQQAPFGQGGYRYDEPMQRQQATELYPQENEPASGLSHIRQMDSSFDEAHFRDQAMDIFFKVQGAWMNRDLASADGLLTPEMRRLLQEDVDRLLREKRVNRLENIAVRNVELVEAWQEGGEDFITTRIYANLLDYTTDDATGEVVAGSRTEPVKFAEHWTFTRPVGNNPWRLTAISQA